MSKLKNTPIDENRFQVYNLKGECVLLNTLTDPAELRILLAREWLIKERLIGPIYEAYELASKSDTEEVMLIRLTHTTETIGELKWRKCMS